MNTGVSFEVIYYIDDPLGWSGAKWVTFALFFNKIIFTKNCLTSVLSF